MFLDFEWSDFRFHCIWLYVLHPFQKIESTFCFQRSDSPSSLSNGNSDGVSAPDSPTFLGGRRAMSVMNVASTGGSLSREKNATGGSGSSKGTTVSASGLPRYNTEFGFNTGWAFFLPSKTLVLVSPWAPVLPDWDRKISPKYSQKLENFPKFSVEFPQQIPQI